MATQLQLRRGTTSETGSFTGAVGEVTVDTTKDTLVVHDGATAGGHEMAKKDGSNMTAIDVGDNVQLKMGDSDDLLVYHDSNNSYIKDAGNGNLYINANEFRVGNADNSKDYIHGNNGAEVKLFHNGSPKIATTSSGVDVTGTATMDGLTVVKNGNTGANTNTTGSGISLTHGSSAEADQGLALRCTGSGFNGINGLAFTSQIVADTTSSNALEMFTTASSPLVLGTNATKALSIDTSQNVSIPNGDLTVASGNGVFLGGTAAANKLDDYEEGTWNPTLTFSSGSVTYGTRLGTYTKVGRQVTVQMSFGLSAVSSPSGNLSITGLPFTNASGEGFVTALNFALIRFLGTEYNTVRGFLGNGTTTITLTTNATNANAAYLNANTLTANSLIYATLTYFAA